MLAIGLVVISLLVFSALGFEKAEFSTFQMGHFSITGIAIATGILYINFQGFGVVTNSSSAMRSPQRELPIAMFSALILVTVAYLAVSSAVILLMPLSTIELNSGHVLADAAALVAGKPGQIIISISALLACAAAVNATIFAASNIAADVVKKRMVSSALGNSVLKTQLRALTVSSIGVILFALAFPLAEVGQMASLAFLLVYAVITFGHLRVHQVTGAKPAILWVAIAINVSLFVALFINTIKTAPTSAIALVAALIASIAIESISRFWHPRQA
jgi:amino acid transporter